MMIIVDDWISHRDDRALWALIFLFKWAKEAAAGWAISQQPENIFNNSGGEEWMNVCYLGNVMTISNTFQKWPYQTDQRASLEYYQY